MSSMIVGVLTRVKRWRPLCSPIVALGLLATITGMILVSDGRGQDAPQEKTVTFSLHGGRNSSLQFGLVHYQGLLSREIYRQALLIAARDEFGLQTRDLHLGQNLKLPNAKHFDLILVGAKINRLEILDGEPPYQSLVARQELPTPAQVELLTLVVDAESRSRNEFADFLKKQGFTSRSRQWNPAAEVPSAAKKLIADMNFVSQWQAVCLLHAAIAKDGESEGRLAILSRAYANLGVLTERHWHATHKVFKARALLYAQRLVAREKDLPLAYETRAYALTLAGLPNEATLDLNEVDRLRGGDPAAATGMTKLMRDYITFRFGEIAPENQDSALDQVTKMLRYLAREYSQGNEAQSQAARVAIDELPQCYRLHFHLADLRIVGEGNAAIAEGLADTAETLYRRVAFTPNIPPEIKAIADEGARLGARAADFEFSVEEEFACRGKLIDAMLDSSEPVLGQSELDWSTLAELIRDHAFVQAIQEVSYLNYSLGVPPEPALDKFEPILKSHPYRFVIDYYRSSRPRRVIAMKQVALADIDNLDLGAKAIQFLSSGDPDSPVRQKVFSELLVAHLDHTATDQANSLACSLNEPIASELLFQTWPQSSMAKYYMLIRNWSKLKNDFAKWEKFAAEDPLLLPAIAYQLAKEKKFAEAAEILERSVRISADYDSYELLTFCYRNLKDEDRELQSLRAALELPDRGLTHARFNMMIANVYLKRGDNLQALPYAETAAECYSEWGLRSAATVHAKLGNWTEAERYFRAISERYNTLDWYEFTHGRNLGDLVGTLQFTQRMAARGVGATANPYVKSQFYMMTGEPKKAIEILIPLVEKYPNDMPLRLLLISAYDETKATEDRDQVLESSFQVVTGADSEARRGSALYLRGLVELLHEDVGKGGKAELDDKAIDEARK